MLAPDGATDLFVEYDNGSSVSSTEVTWEMINLLNPPTNAITIRQNDALLLGARSEDGKKGSMVVYINGVANYATLTETPVPHVFDLPGTYEVRGLYSKSRAVHFDDDTPANIYGFINGSPANGVFNNGNTQTSEIFYVTVIGADFGQEPICVAGEQTEWSCPDIGSNILVESAADLTVSRSQADDGSATFTVQNDTGNAKGMVARAYENGPILDNALIQSLILDGEAAPDLDGDGLADWWGLYYGVSGADSDADGDGLTNLQEYRYGLDPLVSDADRYAAEAQLVGDGETTPSSALGTTVASVPGNQIFSTLGTWVFDGSAVYAASRRGHVEYKVSLSQGSIYQAEISIRQKRIVEPGRPESYRLRIEVDGEYISRQTVPLVDDVAQAVMIETPFLDAGEHIIQVCWDNYENDISLQIEGVDIKQLDGVDRNENGALDWVENTIIQRNTIDVAPLVSLTSPACLEGKALYAKLMRVAGNTGMHPGPNGTWFGNVDLNSDGLSHSYDVSFENNARTLSRSIQWKPTNVLTDYVGGSIRAGDALLLVAVPASGMPSNGLSRIFVNGQEVISSNMAESYAFAAGGIYQVRGLFTGIDGNGISTTVERTIQVTVVGVEPEAIAAVVDKERPWSIPDAWPAGSVVELDSRIIQSIDAEGNPTLMTTVPEERYGLVRLGANGPVLAPVAVKGFNMWFMKKTYLHYDEVFEDGSFTATTTMIISPNVPEVWVDQRARGVITYYDGSRARKFYYSDYNNVGELEILFIHPKATATSVCHYTEIYQQDVLLGRSY